MGVALSVVIPTRNRPDLLARCLDRLAPGAQSLDAREYEVIVSDDGGDDTARIHVGVRYPWVRWTRGPQRGPAANRNAGARLATGPFLVFTDDDCLPDREWLAAFRAAAAAGVELSPGRVVSREPRRSPVEHAPLNETGDAIWSCNMLVRHDRFVALGGFDERFPHAHMEDLDFQVRARSAGLVERFSRDAVVDHPPRRLASGRVLGATHYGEVLFGVLHDRPPSLARTLRAVTAMRLRAIREHRLSGDTWVAVRSLAAELIHVVTYWRTWRWRAAAVARK